MYLDCINFYNKPLSLLHKNKFYYMSCVNKSSKEFKDLASKHGISANTLELITHKYWLETGSEENFPTDVYIQAQLGNNSYQ